MKKLNFSKRMEKMKNDSKKSGKKAKKPPTGKVVYKEVVKISKSICPFMSTPDKEVKCNSSCQFFRSNKRIDYACIFMELPPISQQLFFNKKGSRK